MSPSIASISIPSAYAIMLKVMSNRFRIYMVENYGNDHGGGVFTLKTNVKNIDVDRNIGDRENPLRGLTDSVFKFIENEVEMMKPERLLYLSFDGVAPIAKIILQRKRRIEDYEEDLNKLTSLLLKGLLGDAKHKAIENARKMILFRYELSYELSPGTDVMRHLSARIKVDIEQKRQSGDENWIGLKVVLSDSDVAEELEQRIMSFIKEYGYTNDQSHAIYSPYLRLLTHEVDLFVYYEVRGR